MKGLKSKWSQLAIGFSGLASALSILHLPQALINTAAGM